MPDQDHNPTPDWLGGTEDEPANADDWMKGLSFEDDQAPSGETEASPPESVAPAAEDALAWLRAEDEGATEAGETPDWLLDVESAAQTASKQTTRLTDWMEDVIPDDEPGTVSAAETPDWLAHLQPPDASDAAPAPAGEPEGADEPAFAYDWIDRKIAEEEAEPLDAPLPSLTERLAAEPLDEAADWHADFVEPSELASDTPDWLNELRAAEDAAMAARAEAGPLAEEPSLELPLEPVDVAPAPLPSDWREDFEVEEPPVAATAGTEEWLSAVEQSPVPGTEPETVAAASPDEWPLAEAAEADAEPSFAADLDEAVAEPQFAEELDLEAEPETAVVEAATDEWLSAIEQAEVPEPAPDMAEAAAELESALPEFADDEGLIEEAEPVVAHLPADNAPDWLNAMVPGVDLDYEAREEAPADAGLSEPAPEPEPTAPAPAFAWLSQLVEEETRPEPAYSAERGRFVFSRPPLWLRDKLPLLAARGAMPDAAAPASD